MNSNMFLEELELDECDSISSPGLVPTLRYLRIKRCQNLIRFLIPNGTERLLIWGCENLEILLSSVRILSIEDCKKLKQLPELLPSLKELTLRNCPEIESFPDGGLPFNLQLLRICNCEKLVNGRKEWCLQRLPSLRELYITHDGSDEEIVGGENWELPCSIRSLEICNLKTLSSQLLKSLTSLESLWTLNLPQIQSLVEQGLPSSVSELHLCFHDELHSLQGLQHLNSLQNLYITNCPQLQSLEESVFPSSLSTLTIENCPNLQSLPVKGMPSSLSKLSIYKCPMLEPLLEFDQGELASDLPKPEKVLVVERVIESLGLQPVRDSLVGTVEKRGISGGQRKRVNVGLEMVMEPSLLILDEPTSGLDSSSSQLLLRATRREALEGVNVCMVVHQPRMFDDLVLLAKGGLTVYHGPVKTVEEYFAGIRITVPDRVNPPDHFIDILEGIYKLPRTGLNYKDLPVR
ncbi:ABC transporter G family member 24 [Capsicum baccatum]|uniref:ABC transporter G family member 24 n=1 Tax=Capsicum baccatum TaxID=33114 RepID=A0A2G2VQL7_CAPBA|nr:ABC transporter G family member 24 [Capsicum baccatum]